MKTINCLRGSALLLPILALGLPLANASEPAKTNAQESTVAAETTSSSESGHKGYLGALPARGYHSDSLVGRSVMNRRNNEDLGEVSNLILNERGQVLAVIVSVGGVMGLGARDVAIEWDQIERKRDGDDIKLSVDLSEENLENAPKYAGQTTQRNAAEIGADRTSPRSGSRNDQMNNQPDRQHDETSSNQRANQATAPEAARSKPQSSASAGKAAYIESTPARGFHSDTLVGKEIKNRSNKASVGTVNNLLLDSNGQVVAVVVSVGGLMGIGEHDVAIAWDQIERQVQGEEATFWVDVNEQSLKDAPRYSAERSSSSSTSTRK